MSHLCYRHYQKALQHSCETTPACDDSCGCNEDNNIESMCLSRTVTRSTFKDPLSNCTEPLSRNSYSYWKMARPQIQFNNGSEVPTTCLQYSFSDDIPMEIKHCKDIPPKEDCCENKEDHCKEIKKCLKKKCCKNSQQICSLPMKRNSNENEEKSNCNEKSSGKIVLNFNMNLTPELTSMFEKIL